MISHQYADMETSDISNALFLNKKTKSQSQV